MFLLPCFLNVQLADIAAEAVNRRSSTVLTRGIAHSILAATSNRLDDVSEALNTLQASHAAELQQSSASVDGASSPADMLKTTRKSLLEAEMLRDTITAVPTLGDPRKRQSAAGNTHEALKTEEEKLVRRFAAGVEECEHNLDALRVSLGVTVDHSGRERRRSLFTELLQSTTETPDSSAAVPGSPIALPRQLSGDLAGRRNVHMSPLQISTSTTVTGSPSSPRLSPRVAMTPAGQKIESLRTQLEDLKSILASWDSRDPEALASIREAEESIQALEREIEAQQNTLEAATPGRAGRQERVKQLAASMRQVEETQGKVMKAAQSVQQATGSPQFERACASLRETKGQLEVRTHHSSKRLGTALLPPHLNQTVSDAYKQHTSPPDNARLLLSKAEEAVMTAELLEKTVASKVYGIESNSETTVTRNGLTVTTTFSSTTSSSGAYSPIRSPRTLTSEVMSPKGTTSLSLRAASSLEKQFFEHVDAAKFAVSKAHQEILGGSAVVVETEESKGMGKLVKAAEDRLADLQRRFDAAFSDSSASNDPQRELQVRPYDAFC